MPNDWCHTPWSAKIRAYYETLLHVLACLWRNKDRGSCFFSIQFLFCMNCVGLCGNSQDDVLRGAVNRFPALNGSVQYQLLAGTVNALCARSAFTFSVFKKFLLDCVFQILLPGNKGPEPPTDDLPTTSPTTPASAFIYICVTRMQLMQHCRNESEVKCLWQCLSSFSLLFPSVVQSSGIQSTQNI